MRLVHCTMAVLTAAVAAAATLPAQVAASNAATAWRFTYAVTRSPTTPAPGAAPAAATDLAFDVTVWKGRARVVVRSGPLRAMTGDQGAVLVRDGDSVLTVINPVRKEILLINAGDLGGMPGAGPQLDVSDVRSAVIRRGAGPRLLGFATQRVVVTEAYTLTAKTPAGARTVRTTQESDVLVSASLARLDAGFRAFTEHFTRLSGQPPFVRQRLRALQGSMPPGVPVQSVGSVTIESDAQQMRAEVRSTLTDLRRESVDTMAFVVPAGFRVTDMNRLLQRRRAP